MRTGRMLEDAISLPKETRRAAKGKKEVVAAAK